MRAPVTPVPAVNADDTAAISAAVVAPAAIAACVAADAVIPAEPIISGNRYGAAIAAANAITGTIMSMSEDDEPFVKTAPSVLLGFK